MRTSMVDISKIRNRKMSQSRVSSIDSKYYYNIANSAIRENSSMIKMESERFFRNCNDKVNANKYFKNCISIMENVEGNELRSLSYIFSSEIVPAITDLDFAKECVENSSLNDNVKERILISIKENKICDRVLSNSKNISKRFNLEKIISESRHLPLMEPVFECCRLLDTYDMPEYGKLNLALEQLSYYLQKENIPYARNDLAKYVTEYFTITNKNLTNNELYGFRNVLKENMFLEDCDSKDCGQLAVAQNYSYDMKTNPIQNAIDAFSVCSNKTDEDIKSLIDTIIDKPLSIIISNLEVIFEFFRTLILLEIYPNSKMNEIVNYFFDSLFDIDMSRNDVEQIHIKIKAELKVVEQLQSRLETPRLQAMKIYELVIRDCINHTEYSLGTLYPDKVESDNKSWNDTNDSMSLQEFKIFKFQNLITAVLNIDKFLNRKGNKFLDGIKKKSKKIFSTTKKFFTESGISPTVFTDKGNFDVCIAVYEANSESDMMELNYLFNKLCGTLNTIESIPSGSRVNYVNIANRFEVHYEDSTIVDFGDSINESLSEYDLFNAYTISSICSYLEAVSKFDNDKFVTEMYYSIKDADTFISIIEALQYTGLANIDNIKSLEQDFNISNYGNYKANTKLSQIVENWKAIDTPYDIMTEAVECMNVVVSEKVDLNAIKLSIEGLKGKMKDMGAKEKEMSRNLDINMNHFMNSMKNAMTNDRREAIIKGSVIPSFSRCLKIGIGLAGIAAFNPLAAVITAFAGLAVSKNLNAKERRLMLDEIDIELKALDKEIQMAEDNKNMKKYRQLLTYQKQLQREKQRIKYNIKVAGGTDVPDSTVGTTKD